MKYKLVRPLSAVLFLYGMICYLAAVTRSFQIIRFPFTIDYGESTTIHQIKTLFDGLSPYSQSAADSFNYFSYTPLFPFLASLLGHDPESWLFAARIINTLSLVGVGLLIAKMYYDWQGRDATTWDFALPFILWFSWFPVSNWMGVGRIDGLALLFQVLGLYFYLKPVEKSSSKMLGILCFVLAFYTKQSAVWIPLSLMLWEATRLNRKDLGGWSLYFAAIVGGLFVLNQFSGGFLWSHLFESNRNEFRIDNLLIALKDNGTFHLGILLVAASGLVKLNLKSSDGLMALLAVTSLIWVVGAGREGSSSNFLLEFSIVVTWFAARGARKLNQSKTISWVATLVVVATCWHNVVVRSYFIKDPGPELFWSNFNSLAKDSTEKVLELVRNSDGPVWSENPSLSLYAGKEIIFWPFEFGQAIARKSMNEDELLKQLADKKVSLVIRESATRIAPVQRLSDKMLQLIGSNYKIIYYDDFYVVYAPNQ
ncbi:hypothetical protein [Bdellovibrio sp. HCB274]|uniref:hypothetical protein n=1 Tax=Bdellovibrio sp. HCB274 TaxID=3394361 RepID=UPI0039B3A1F1